MIRTTSCRRCASKCAESAIREATRDGAPPIDLVDGDEWAEKLKELDLGVETELVEQVTVDEEWFEQI